MMSRWLVKTGNRKIAPPDFRWLFLDQIDAMSHPQGLVVVERIEWGNAYGKPVALNFGSEPTRPVEGDQIAGELFASIERANDVRKQIDNLEKVAERNPDPLASEADWIEFERDLTGAREVPPIPYQMIRHANDEQLWAEDFSRLSKDQIEAAADGFNAVEGMKGIYTDGTATEQTTGKLFLWGMLSRMLSAHPHESAFLDAAVSDKLDECVQRAVDDPWNQADVSEYLEWAGSVIPDYAPGKQGTTNMNDFGKVFLAILHFGLTGLPISTCHLGGVLGAVTVWGALDWMKGRCVRMAREG